MGRIGVLLVDDHALFRSGVAAVLAGEADFEVVGEASDGSEAIEKARELMPDIVLMDVYMQGMGGLEATRNLKKELPYIKIVMLTVSDEEKDLFEAIKSGAQGYLLKKMEPRELLETLRGALRGEAPLSRGTAGKILGEFTRLAGGASKDEPLQRISPREREVLELLTTGATNKEMAAKLCISENTIKNHLKNILEKLHLKNRVQAAAFALREGFAGKDSDES